MDNSEKKEPVLFYIGLYAFLYTVVFSVISALHSIFDVPIWWISTSICIAAFTATKFIKATGRLITRSEKGKLIFGTFFCTVLINSLFFDSRHFINFLFSGGDLEVSFVVWQFLILLSLSIIFGPVSTDISIPPRDNNSQR